MSISDRFPDITDGYRITSGITNRYNSIAWAMSENQRWWEPDPFEGAAGFYWPNDLADDHHLTTEVLLRLFRRYGYERCDNSLHENNYEKIAIYIDSENGQPQHVARQKDCGKWTSKIDRCEDIEHDTPEHIATDDSTRGVGILYCFLRRQIVTQSTASPNSP